MGIGALEKPMGCACQHQVAGGGCATYETRPAECRTFTCGWLAGHLREGDRPDVLGIMLSGSSAGAPFHEFGPVLVHEVRPGAFGEPPVCAIVERLSRQGPLVKLRGQMVVGIGAPPRRLRKMAEAAKKLFARQRVIVP
jgi:hypothetical protein